MHGGQVGALYQWPWLLKGHQNVPVPQWHRAKGRDAKGEMPAG